MIGLFLFLSIAFLITFLLGRLLEKVKIPWIFAALFLGSILAVSNPFAVTTSSDTFIFLAQLGMYSLLFIIGFELDLNELLKQGKFIIKSTFFIILFEAFFGFLFVHFLFGTPWFVSLIVALSFATVGEAILIPILDEFKIINTKLGRSIIGIGTLDDVIEIVALILAMLVIGSSSTAPHFDLVVTFASLFGMFALAFGLTKLKKESSRFMFLDIPNLFIFVFFVLFLFLAVGQYADAAPIGALLAGISLRTFLPKVRIASVEKEIRAICYGFFAPIFFIWVGVTMNVGYLVSYPLLIILIIAVSSGAKLLASWLVARKELGARNSVLLSVGLSVRFSTSIVIVKILFDNALIGLHLYSVIVASSIIFTFIIPPLFSHLLLRWGVAKAKKG